MKDDLAEVLLAKVMGWGEEDVSRERPYLQAIGAYKYDKYQQFSPGMRFIESLAIWLGQFKTIEERSIAYHFVKNRMIFISEAEMAHLVATAYPDLIRPIILKRAAKKTNIPEYMLKKTTQSIPFKALQRQSLFLGLSDGAHTDTFRRSNTSEIWHEQVYQTYEISPARAENMLLELKKDLQTLLQREPMPEEVQFKMVFLLDDFAGSGITYLRREKDNFDGKIARLYKDATNPEGPLGKLFNIKDTIIYLILYCATSQAITYIRDLIPGLWNKEYPPPEIVAVHQLSKDTCLLLEKDSEILKLCKNNDYYDAESLEDKNTKKGGKDVIFGFGDCRLPLVLSHNTPNNSLALLWAYEDASFRGLFPRVPRHKEFI
jgi:hypothetical protein